MGQHTDIITRLAVTMGQRTIMSITIPKNCMGVAKSIVMSMFDFIRTVIWSTHTAYNICSGLYWLDERQHFNVIELFMAIVEVLSEFAISSAIQSNFMSCTVLSIQSVIERKRRPIWVSESFVQASFWFTKLTKHLEHVVQLAPSCQEWRTKENSILLSWCTESKPEMI